jgi:death-on-curing protein
MHYLTRDDLLDLHAYVIMRYGGRLGIASQDRLVGALNAPQQVMFGAELYPDLPSKAAALTFLLLKGRPFLNGNQGSALFAMLRFLAINNATLREDIGAFELLHIIRAVDQSEMDKDRLEQWLRENVVRDEG